jgi:hypothetical protein
MKTIKKYTVNGEIMKIKELNKKEQQENRDYKYFVTIGEYDDVEFECDSLKECEENIASY